MIWLGPAGIPTCCKGSTLVGIKTVKQLGLNAMEVQFVRGVRMKLEQAKECGELASKLKVKLSVHAPYFVNLCSRDEAKLEASKLRVVEACERANLMKAEPVVFHPGYYGELSKEEAFKMVKEACKDIDERIEAKGFEVKLGLETTGKTSQFGTLDEILEICKQVKACVPVIDFAHLFARQSGMIDYAKLFNKLEALRLDYLHSHFTCVEFKRTSKGGDERRHLILEAKQPDFLPLAKEILKRKLSVVIISESPILEQDSLKMKMIFEQLGWKF